MKNIFKQLNKSKNEKKENIRLLLDQNREKNLSNSINQYIKAKPFKNQDIKQIRENGTVFTDEFFKPSLQLIVSDHVSSSYSRALFSFFKCKNKLDLKSQIKWKRCQV